MAAWNTVKTFLFNSRKLSNYCCFDVFKSLHSKRLEKEIQAKIKEAGEKTPELMGEERVHFACS